MNVPTTQFERTFEVSARYMVEQQARRNAGVEPGDFFNRFGKKRGDDELILRRPSSIQCIGSEALLPEFKLNSYIVGEDVEDSFERRNTLTSIEYVETFASLEGKISDPTGAISDTVAGQIVNDNEFAGTASAGVYFDDL